MPPRKTAKPAGNDGQAAPPPDEAVQSGTPEDKTTEDTASVADGDGHQETGATIVITTPIPPQVQVRSQRRIVIELNLADHEAADLVTAVSEMAGYVDYHSEGGYRSDPRLLFELVNAIQAELTRPGWDIPAPGLGEFLSTEGLSADEEGEPGEVPDGAQMAAAGTAASAPAEDAGEPPQGS